MKRISAAALLLFALACASAKEIAVLTIGNSFAQSAFVYLPSVVKSAPGCSLHLEGANHGGCSLSRHWRYISEEEKDPSVRRYRNGKSTLRQILQSRKWDIITIQQASHESWRPETYFPCAEKLRDYIKKCAPTAEICIQQTWSYRSDDPRISKGGKWNIDQSEMFARAEKNYADAAKKLGLRVIPTGKAVQNYRSQETRPFEPRGFSNCRYPDLPPQAGDIVGRTYWRKQKDGEMRIARDTIHLNDSGNYLQACVWFGFLFDKNPEEISFVPDTIGNSQAAKLRSIAARTLAEFRQPKDAR